jgi:tRNA-(ms[2]io[6]A)-hydroxylase
VTAPAGDFPLLTRTTARWGSAALEDPLSLLNDHAHLEKKAALNAMELIHRWPDGGGRDEWVLALASIAKDETAHLHAVARLLQRRGGALSRGHKNPYAAALHARIRMGRGPDEVVDRLLVSALIEARSCERFGVLREAAKDKDFSELYGGLWSSEKGHFTAFLGLAHQVGSAERRWKEFLEIEADVLAAQSPGPRMHAGEPI